MKVIKDAVLPDLFLSEAVGFDSHVGKLESVSKLK